MSFQTFLIPLLRKKIIIITFLNIWPNFKLNQKNLQIKKEKKKGSGPQLHLGWKPKRWAFVVIWNIKKSTAQPLCPSPSSRVQNTCPYLYSSLASEGPLFKVLSNVTISKPEDCAVGACKKQSPHVLNKSVLIQHYRIKKPLKSHLMLSPNCCAFG